ncbi:hypothetical protein SAY86_009477 [Trapa natans]|uniref:Rhodanese domain-containing protein n=1 Tax=Trapa natans TaxID=22666 RepID=A0AAN7QQ96_TRANT|nr:hypothetical protein SAY86_009477 [Trapa natans]
MEKSKLHFYVHLTSQETLLSSPHGGSRRAEDVATVDVHTARGLLSTDHIYLDVRTEEEFNRSHVEGALNVPFVFITSEGMKKNPDFLSKVASICNKEDRLVVGCHSGGRSIMACVDLVNAGYTGVRNMGGGYCKWVDAGFAADQGKVAQATKKAEDVETVDVHTAKGLLSNKDHVYLDVRYAHYKRPCISPKRTVGACLRGNPKVVLICLHGNFLMVCIYSRTEEEFNKSHVEGALNVPFMFKTSEGKKKNPDFLSKVTAICKKEDRLVVGCNSGGRSIMACVELVNAGYANVRNMEGGYSKWVDAGFAADQGKPAEELKTACKFRSKT